MPIQFVAVVVISAALVVYLSGWAALARVEARSESYRASAFGEPAVVTPQGSTSVSSDGIAEKQAWESVALLVCPLH